MTGQGTTDTAIEATKRGAFDYQLKPFEPAEMLQTIAKALEAARLMKGRLALNPETAAAAVRRHRRTQPADAATLQGDRAGGPDRRDRAHPRGIGHGQGTGGPRHLSA